LTRRHAPKLAYGCVRPRSVERGVRTFDIFLVK
jgi:hypothetical protein